MLIQHLPDTDVRLGFVANLQCNLTIASRDTIRCALFKANAELTALCDSDDRVMDRDVVQDVIIESDLEGNMEATLNVMYVMRTCYVSAVCT